MASKASTVRGVNSWKVSSYGNTFNMDNNSALNKLHAAREEAILDRLQKKKNKLSEEEYKNKLKKALELEDKIWNRQKENLKKFFSDKQQLQADVDKLEWANRKKEAEEELKAQAKGIISLSRKERKEAGITQEEFGKALKVSMGTFSENLKALIDFSKQLTNQIDTIASYQSRWNTRLQGTGLQFQNSASKQGISSRLQGIVGASPLVQLKDVYKNLDTLLDKGISYNIEQRAFLETIRDKIANTFDVANGTLLQLVRVQQADTTAARLGLEANLTRYFNSMYMTTEYLYDQFDTVSGNLYEATSQLSATEGVAFEYQVQKWLGSLYSVGMSSGAVSNIASALGQLGSGNISGLSDEMLKLLTISANNANIGGLGKILKEGLDASNTNKLMQAMVNYLKTIANTDSNVVRSQLASVFGLTVSDLTAISNLAVSTADVYGSNLSYSGAMNELMSQANGLYSRLSTGEIMSNLWENIQYGLSSGIASNPVMYALWKTANALDTLGGVDIPFISTLGTGVNLNTDVSQIMRVGALSGGLFSSIGNLIMGISGGSAGGFSGAGMLKALGLSNKAISVLSRGSGMGTFDSGDSVSQQTYVGNTSGDDVLSAELTGANDQKLELLNEEEETDIKIKQVDEHLVDLTRLIEGVISGFASFHVKIDTGV